MSPQKTGFHLSDDQLVDRLYGIASEEDAHLASCPACQARWSQIQQRHSEAILPASIPVEYLQEQRRQIQNRFGASAPAWAVWVPAAVALVLVAGLFGSRPTPKVAAPAPDASELIEAGWFEDTYSAMRVMEPRAVSPIRELFTEGPVLE